MKICLFGAAPDSGNLGVTALCHGALHAIFAADPSAEVTVFDYSRGVRTASLGEGLGPYSLIGGYPTRRLYRRESLWNIELCAKLGGLGNPGAKTIAAADLVLDISGGDSFSDIYGSKVFRDVSEPKRLALRLSKPLVLLPQTYGPFANPQCRAEARRIVLRAQMAWARDPRSYECLRELAGNEFDPMRHRCGVDVAFAVPAVPAPGLMPEPMQRWLQVPDGPIVGLNVSGLLLNDPQAAAKYGLKADYRKVVRKLISRLLDSGARLLLLPHVLGAPGAIDSDVEATARLAADFADRPDQLAVPVGSYGPEQAKWLISCCDWFCGTRMHATVGALSMGVPTAAVAYSIKTLGVFETCGQGNHVADPRKLTSEAVVDQLWQSFSRRQEAKAELALRTPGLAEAAVSQMRAIREGQAAA